MTHRPVQNFVTTILFFFKTLVANFKACRALKKENKMRKKGDYKTSILVPGFTILDAENKAGIRQFISYSPKTKSYYVEAVGDVHILNQEFKWPTNRRNIWKALDECDRMSDQILLRINPELVKK